MYNNYQFRDYYKRNLSEALKPINKEIEKEKSKENCDTHKLLKLEESKLFAGLFTDIFGYNERFKNPY